MTFCAGQGEEAGLEDEAKYIKLCLYRENH